MNTLSYQVRKLIYALLCVAVLTVCMQYMYNTETETNNYMVTIVEKTIIPKYAREPAQLVITFETQDHRQFDKIVEGITYAQAVVGQQTIMALSLADIDVTLRNEKVDRAVAIVAVFAFSCLLFTIFIH